MADVPTAPASALPGPPRGALLLGYIEDMLLELAHMAATGGETGLAATLAVAAIQCGGELRSAERREGARG